MFRRGGGEARFNHDSVGITDPSLHVAVGCPPSASDASGGPDDCWWPSAGSPGGIDGGWRVLRYRRRVGRGDRCYEAVRDAALGWEFRAGGEPSDDDDDDAAGGGAGGGRSMGLIREPTPPSPSSPHRPFRQRTVRHAGYDVIENVPWNDCEGFGDPLSEEAARSVAQIWSCSGGGGGGGVLPGRRMITYTEAGGGGLRARLRLPSLYAANPVAVAYDLVDQRGPGATYTSTAYATLGGHLLCGEERVTVAIRDGDEGHVDVELLSYSRPAPTPLGRIAWPLIGGMQGEFFAKELDALERVAVQHGATAGMARGDSSP